MPWLAPIGTPVASGAIDSQDPSWQSSRASRSPGSAFTRFTPASTSSDSPRSAWASAKGCASAEQMPSTQWSTARMPVDRASHFGVCPGQRRVEHHGAPG